MATKTLSFNTLWKHAQEYTAFDAKDYLKAYNCFMWALEASEFKSKVDEFDIRKFNFFMLSWRHTAQQAHLNQVRTPKSICRDAYEAYTAPIPSFA
ncbi:hypothetical protein [Burkholderia cenocepacia]|uniref:Uncharacterized protein n=1 Tax=Burkholderia cenocepacia TaxID=95486 RepID=A0ABD4UDJ0_9BURK|nr:hypothetical protein [Burkholderia cenocepacia]MCW3696342.1 hypothetical protein [Burkholderia cenocepacia]MCW3704439.1 hypothetical protein [Burkholderia cenocepacia]MCW3712122.1 hypothetical protein [Burkholderia cenocepacia]MCW3720121.1 hypothetical protein [Burkholderia cenocepacia]MCW3727815.1 hypothetical protein [Burkholderia cenocepacia]